MNFPARHLSTLTCALALLAGSSATAQSKNPSDYPFRLHIFESSETNFYHGRSIDESKGDGRANLFAKGEVRGVDFNFQCSDKLKASFGFETYPAKWKTPDKELIVLVPVFGKAGSFFTCDLHTDMKDFAYDKHEGKLSQESPADFKAWMVKHDYDPEHGKNMPSKASPPAAR